MVKSEYKVVSYDEGADQFIVEKNGRAIPLDAGAFAEMVNHFDEPLNFIGMTFNTLVTGQLRKHSVSEISINSDHDMYFGEFGIEDWGWVDPRCDLDFLNTLLEHPEFLFFLVENKDEILKQAWGAAKQGIGAEIELM